MTTYLAIKYDIFTMLQNKVLLVSFVCSVLIIITVSVFKLFMYLTCTLKLNLFYVWKQLSF